MYKKRIVSAFFLFLAVALGAAFAQAAPEQHALEQRVLELINIERERHDLPPYIWHNTLAGIARTHSEDMLQNNFVSNTSSDGLSGLARLRQRGLTNITGTSTLVYGGANNPEQRLTNWMNSDSARAIILHEDRSHIAVSIVQRPAGSAARQPAYWTLMVVNVSVSLTPAEIRAYEQRVFELVNIERVNRGLRPLIWHDTIAAAARAHSMDILRNNLVPADFRAQDISGHAGSDGSTARQRMERAGLTNISGASENLSYGRRTPEAAVEGWMNSPGHRANILNPNRTHTGVGLVLREEGMISTWALYWTQKFATFR